ncbi:MAG TPA: hypothetical protein ENK20_11410 [Chromatiales bacterium]|nr:hypothetical protein [Chromatiales bacterium]
MRKRLRRRDLIWALQVECGLSEEAARDAVRTILKVFAGTMCAGLEMELRGFGRWRPDPDAPFVPAPSLRDTIRRARDAGFPRVIRMPRLPRLSGPKAKVIRFPKERGRTEIDLKGFLD